ncbi:SLAC1 anion channel family protein [Methylobacterium trifolii]|uniref:Tellurite resistance protein TehA n=1 Tax=Methylobacterium trifolii TaxID=1003092 RepID=A0ABQ4U6D2_9HYPH|nr:SLAC1 anion channel family protein [Methylobacterium trifolii]GJE62791.1 Tellurite resistance protein TehA [Methylobacterium trifolii]
MPDLSLEPRAAPASETVLTAHVATGAAPAVRGGWRQVEALPVGLFASVMGLTGLSVAWTLAHARYGTSLLIGEMIGWVAVAAFAAVALGYAGKLVLARQAARAEFYHPIAGNLFRTPLISLLLLPIPLAPVSLTAARVMWVVGAVGMSMFAWLIVTRWLGERQQAAHATPAWIVPVVGLLDVPLALPMLGLPPDVLPVHGVMVFGLAVGLFFAVPLLTLILSRLLFEAPMPPALQPSLLILVAPSAVGFSTYVAVTGAVDLFAEALYAITLFLLAVTLPKLARFSRSCPFRVSWWAVSLPLAASAAAALRLAGTRPGWATDGVALALLALATLVILWLLVRTLAGLVRGELRTLSQ